MSENEQIEKGFERWWEEFFEGESYERILVMHRLEREKFESAYRAGVKAERERIAG